MRRLPRPAFLARENLALCAASIQNLNLRNRIGLAADEAEAAEVEYVQRGEEGTLHLTSPSDGLGTVTTQEMKRVYKGTFVRSARTRSIYDALKKAPQNDICPLCAQRTVFHLDHYLPQESYAALSVTAVNLVPACAECNIIKLDLQPGVAEEQTLHPYFDTVDDGRWLFAHVLETLPASLVFVARPPDDWDDIKRARVSHHFEVFKLGALYASHAAEEVGNIRYGLQRMAVRKTPDEISSHLREIAVSCADAHINAWQRATYDALADSAWFCAGGFVGP